MHISKRTHPLCDYSPGYLPFVVWLCNGLHNLGGQLPCVNLFVVIVSHLLHMCVPIRCTLITQHRNRQCCSEGLLPCVNLLVVIVSHLLHMCVPVQCTLIIQHRNCWICRSKCPGPWHVTHTHTNTHTTHTHTHTHTPPCAPPVWGTCTLIHRVGQIHRIWPYLWWLPCQICHIYTVYIWF